MKPELKKSLLAGFIAALIICSIFSSIKYYLYDKVDWDPNGSLNKSLYNAVPWPQFFVIFIVVFLAVSGVYYLGNKRKNQVSENKK
jgi:hypothetical protein